MIFTHWRFITTVSTFVHHFVLSLHAAWNLINFKNGKVTHVLARPSNNFRVMRNVCTETYPYVKITWAPNDINRFCIHCECSVCLPRIQNKLSVALKTHHLPALAFRCRLTECRPVCKRGNYGGCNPPKFIIINNIALYKEVAANYGDASSGNVH